MDLGAAAEGIAQAYFALFLLASLVLHVLAAVVASVGLVAGGRAARGLSLIALAIVATNHVVLALLGAWFGAVLGGAFIWPVVLAALAAYVGAIAFRSSVRRQAA